MSIAAIAAPVSTEETLQTIAAKAASGEKFLVKVSRRSSGIGAMPSHIATFEDVTMEQISMAESWLSAIFGGGEYSLRISTVKEPLLNIGGSLKYNIEGETRQTLNRSLFEMQNWNGPTRLSYITSTMESRNGNGAVAAGPQNFNGGIFMPIAGPVPAPVAPAVAAPVPFSFNPELERMRAELEKQKVELAERTARAEREMLKREEELKRIDSETRIRAENDAKFAELKASMSAAQTATKPGELIATIATALTPLVGAFMQSSMEARKSQQEMMAAQAARQDQMMQLFLSKMNENKGIDPAITMLFENMKSSTTGAADMMSRMADVMTSSVKNSVAMVEAIADIQLAQQDPGNPMLDVVKEGIKMFGSLGGAAAKGAKTIAGTKPPELPAQRQAQPVPQQTAAAPHAVEPAQVVNFPKGPGAGPVDPAGFAGANIGAKVDPELARHLPFPVQDGEDLITAVRRIIMDRTEPIDDAARFVIMAIGSDDASMKAALNAHNGVFDDWVAAELKDWGFSDPANAHYLMEFHPHFERIGVELEVFEPLEEEEQS